MCVKFVVFCSRYQLEQTPILVILLIIFLQRDRDGDLRGDEMFT